MVTREKKNQQGRKNYKYYIEWLWRFFSSVRLAVILILIIAALSLLGALLIQAPGEIAGDPQLYSSWVDTTASAKTGIWAPFLSALRLFDIFRSPWFLIAGTLLMVNIFICSVNRWKGIRLSLRGGAVTHKASFYAAEGSSVELPDLRLPVDKAALISQTILSAKGYRIRTESDDNNVYTAADKNRYYRLGTYLSHFSLILFVMAFITGNYLGFRESAFTVAEGTVREVGYDTALSLQLVSFTDEYYDNGMPKDYRSQVILYENGREVRQAFIRVNHPLTYKGVRFYQSYFGRGVKILVRDEGGEDICNENISMDSYFDIDGYRYYEGFFELPEKGLTIRLISSESETGTSMIPAGQIAVDVRQGNEQIDLRLIEQGVPRQVGGLEITFLEESRYSGFQVSRDPTNILIWIASTLFIIGICAVLYFPYRQAWVLAQSEGKGTSSLIVRVLTPRGFSSTSELTILARQMEKELKTEEDKKKGTGGGRNV